ncbi:MAG TPA: hypothetical protein VGK29_26660 [Paludibaculum sp.]|jgi:Flp pilus assembly pilin Flp
MVRAAYRIALRARIQRDIHGQDLIEYALLLGLLATAGSAVFPEIHDGIRTVFVKVNRALTGRTHHHDG